MENGLAATERSMAAPQKLKTELLTSYQSSNLTYESAPKITEASLLSNICTPMNIAALFTIAKCSQQMNG